MCAGSYDWLVRNDLISLPKTLDRLIRTMAGWEDWLPNSIDSWKTRVLLQACAFGICNIAVAQKQVLSPADPWGAEITLQQLEADGVVELRPAGVASGVRPDDNGGGEVDDIKRRTLVLLTPLWSGMCLLEDLGTDVLPR